MRAVLLEGLVCRDGRIDQWWRFLGPGDGVVRVGRLLLPLIGLRLARDRVRRSISGGGVCKWV